MQQLWRLINKANTFRHLFTLFPNGFSFINEWKVNFDKIPKLTFSPNGENVNFDILSNLTFHSLVKKKPNSLSLSSKLLPSPSSWQEVGRRLAFLPTMRWRRGWKGHFGTDIIFVTSSTSSASVKYFWICVKLYRINTLTTLLEGKCVKIITQDVSNCKENYTRG